MYASHVRDELFETCALCHFLATFHTGYHKFQTIGIYWGINIHAGHTLLCKINPFFTGWRNSPVFPACLASALGRRPNVCWGCVATLFHYTQNLVQNSISSINRGDPPPFVALRSTGMTVGELKAGFPVDEFCKLVRFMDTGRSQYLLCVPESESCPLKIRAYSDRIRLA